jgi:hypothetical protein
MGLASSRQKSLGNLGRVRSRLGDPHKAQNQLITNQSTILRNQYTYEPQNSTHFINVGAYTYEDPADFEPDPTPTIVSSFVFIAPKLKATPSPTPK